MQVDLGELHDLLRGIHMVKEVTPRLYDYVASFGERLSSKCFAALLRARGHADAEAINAYDLGFMTDSKFMNAKPLPDTYEHIATAFKVHAAKQCWCWCDAVGHCPHGCANGPAGRDPPPGSGPVSCA